MTHGSRAARRLVAIASALAIVFTGSAAMAPEGVRAVGSTPSSIQLEGAELNPKPVGRTTNVIANLSPGGVTGSVTFYDDQGGSRTELGTVPVAGGTVTLPLAADMPEGTYHVVAVYSGDDAYAPSESTIVDVVVGPRPTTTTLHLSSIHDPTGATAQKGDQLTVTAEVVDAGAYPPIHLPIVGNVAIKVDGVTVATIPANTGTDLSTASWVLGAHTIQGVFEPGNVDYAGSSDSKPFQLLANVVEATGVGVQYPTFYPYRDGYRDTVAIRGTRQEPASVSIRVYSPTGKLVKSVSIARVAGAYSYGWTGRNSSGTILAAGKYRVVQTLTDAAGARKVVTSYTTLSKKRLYTYTKTLTKDYTQTAKKTSTWVAWSFTLPSATVYKKLVFSIYGKDNFGGGGFGPHDFSQCAGSYWHPNCVSRARTFPSSFSWKAVGGSTTYDRSGRTVRLYAWGGYGDTRIRYGRVKITYAILK